MFKHKYYSRYRRGLNFCILLIVMGFCRCTDNKMAHDERKPNIVLILTDDQGWGDFSSNGNEIIDTPNLDRLRREGVSFRNFYVSPVCAPTRASLLTGRYALRTGTSWVTHRKEVMRAEELTIAELLKSNGYKTGIFGKWHNGPQYPNDPLGQGFDEFFGFSAGHWNNYFNTTLLHNQEKVQTSGYIADVLTDKALEFIEENKNDPFLCYIPYNTPHGPFQVPDKFYDKYKAKGLNNKDACVYAMCENIDVNVDRILRKLDELGLDDNTIVLFLTDNGPNGHRYNGGMKGIKASVDEGGVKVPLFIRWKGRLAPGMQVSAVSAHIDILPTLAELCQIELPQGLQLDGKSLVPLINGETDSWPNRKVFSYKPSKALTKAGAVRDNNYRMVIDKKDSLFLYNLEEDPGQKNNIAALFPEVTKDLKKAFDDWYYEVTADGVKPPPVPVGFEASPAVELPAPEAQINGKLKFKGKMGWANDWIINWKNAADTAAWLMEVEKGGPFEVILQMNVNDQMAGATVVVSAETGTVTHKISEAFSPENLPSDDRVERGEVYEKPWKELSVGKLDLKKGNQTIKVSMNSRHWNGEAELKALILKSINK